MHSKHLVNARKQNNCTQDDNNISKLQDLLLKELQDQPAKSDNRSKLFCKQHLDIEVGIFC